MHGRTIRRGVVGGTLAACLAVGGFAVISGASGSPRERPVFGLDPGGDVPTPEFAAVSDGHGGIAGYSEVAIMDGTDSMPASPEEALRLTSGPGIVFRVFDIDGKVVGYFASRSHTSDYQGGFIDAAEKDALVAEGWRYIKGSTPRPPR